MARTPVKLLAALFLIWSLSSCALINLGINRPLCVSPPAQIAPSAPEHRWQTFDGTQLPYFESLPAAPLQPRAVVILVPGWDAVTADYQYLTDSLVKRGYAVYGSELRYQSRDPDWLRHGWTADWHAWVRDLRDFTAKVRTLQPGLPIYYHGHSMGCLISLQAMAGVVPPVNGLILQSPAVALMPDQESARMQILRVVLAPVRPPQLLAMSLMHRQLTGDPHWDCAWMASADRVHAGFNVHFVNEACRMGHAALETSRQQRSLPILALQGGRDQAAEVFQPPGRLREYILKDLGAGEPGSRVTYKYYSEGHHLLVAGELPLEKGGILREAVVRDIADWLDQQRRRNGPP